MAMLGLRDALGAEQPKRLLKVSVEGGVSKGK